MEVSATPPTETVVPPSITFKELLSHSPQLLQATERLKFTTPTPVQREALPLAFQGKDLILQAKTGSGKTFAFALPMLHYILNSEGQSNTMGLILTPTRELANQICEVIRSITPDIKPARIIGGVSQNEQLGDLREDRRIVVGTPGRILDLMQQRHLNLRQVEFFAVDEVDEMFSMDFVADVRSILARLPEERQGIFVSATLTPRVEMLANNFLTEPQKVVISSPGEELPPVEHRSYQVGAEVTAKVNALCDLVETLNPRTAIIFCNTKSDTELVEVYLRRRGYDARFLNSDLNQRQRDAVMARIKSGNLRFLIGTDLAARGLDISQVDLVVNYALPDQYEVYTHRCGRTGRAGRSGRAISLIGPQDFGAFMNIKRSTSFDIQEFSLPTEQEVLDARLAHLHAVMRSVHVELNSKELQLAARFLRDVGGLEEPNEEITQIVAKLTRIMLDKVAADKKELVSAEAGGSSSAEPSRPREQNGRHHGHSSRGPRDNGNRGGRNGHRR